MDRLHKMDQFPGLQNPMLDALDPTGSASSFNSLLNFSRG